MTYVNFSYVQGSINISTFLFLYQYHQYSLNVHLHLLLSKKSEIPLRTPVSLQPSQEKLLYYTFIPLGLEVREIFSLLLTATSIPFFLPSAQYLQALNFVSPACTTHHPSLERASTDPGSISLILLRLLASESLSLFLTNQDFAQPTIPSFHFHFLKLLLFQSPMISTKLNSVVNP